MRGRFESLLERTTVGSRPFLDRVLRSLAGVAGRRSDRPATAAEIITLCQRLLSERRERPGTKLAIEVVDAWKSLDATELALFFDRLAREFAVDPAAIDAAAAAYRADRSSARLARLQHVEIGRAHV